MLEVTEDGKLAKFVAAMGSVYFGIGAVLTVMHDCYVVSAREPGGSDTQAPARN
jgi:hypothetical protein